MFRDLGRSIRRTLHQLAAVPRDRTDRAVPRTRFEVNGLHGALPTGWVEVLVELRGQMGRFPPRLVVEGTPHLLANLPGGRARGIVELPSGAELSLEIVDSRLQPVTDVAQ